VRDISEDSCDVLGFREQADDIDTIVAGEVEPAAREVRDAADTQPIDAAQLAHMQRPGTGHPSDRIQRSHRSIEEGRPTGARGVFGNDDGGDDECLNQCSGWSV
jgi:hypothetical protein